MYTRRSRAGLEAELAEVERAIAAHPMMSTAATGAGVVIQAEGTDVEEVQRELATRGLPPVEEIGRTPATTMMSLVRLSRKRVKIRRRLERMGA